MAVLSKNPRKIHDACKEAVVDSLLNNLSARLAGREEFYKVIYGGKPSAELMTEFIVPMPASERNGDEESNPIQISAHGLDFQIVKEREADSIAVQLRGAVYVRILPTADEIKRGGLLEPKFPLTSDARRDLKQRIRAALVALRAELGMTGRGSKMHPDWPARSLAARQASHGALGLPFDNTMDRDKLEVGAEAAAEAEVVPEDDSDSEAPPVIEIPVSDDLPDALAAPIAPPPKWLRLELDMPGFTFTPATAEKDAAVATLALNAAIQAQLDKWAKSADEPYGGQLWGYRHGRPIRPSDIRNWAKYLADVRASGLAVVVPAIDLRWVVQAVPDSLDPSRLSAHLALENWSPPLTAQNRKEMEPSLFQVAMTATLAANAHCFLRLDRVKPSYRYNKYLTYPALGFNGGVVMTESSGTRVLSTTWSPRYVLPRIKPIDRGVERNIAKLAKEDSLPGLAPLVTAYEDWLTEVASYPVSQGLEGPHAKELEVKEREKLQLDMAAWRAELGAIRRGIEILNKSRAHWSGPGPQKSELGIPFEAWTCLNSAMAKVAERKGYHEWHMFQLAFILASIPAFATRIPAFHDFYTTETGQYANAVTLLYFATGGGKSEAFLGLLVFVLFLDRLRGKHHGVSALMRYPLRLLTLQQARRTFAALGAAEEIRHKRGHPGEPFSLGFWVGGTNTPNWHTEEGYSSVPTEKDVPPANEPTYQDKAPYKLYKERWLKLDGCPFCNTQGQLAMRRSSGPGGNALGHYCTAPKGKCSWNARFAEPTPLPFYVVDEDIYDLAPSVLLGTVDKLAALGQSQGTIRKFFGMFGFAPLIEKATNRLFVPQKRKDWDDEPDGQCRRALFPSFASGEKRFFDPFPSLLIQDEAHLLDESLGTFAGLFESALEASFDHLAPQFAGQLAYEPDSTTRRKIKVIAASATVSEPQRQMRNLYQRGHTVQFPYPGPDLYQSFYAGPLQPDGGTEDVERKAIPEENVELRSHWARVYGAILTNGHRHTVAMAAVLGHYHLLITGLYERLRSGDPVQQETARAELVRWIAAGPLNGQHVRVLQEADYPSLLTLVDLHRISLTYVTNKKGGDQVIDTEKVQFDRLHRANGFGEQALLSQLISGAVSAAEIQAIVRRAETRVQPEQPFPELNETLRSVIATSAISHGVDVEEFNAMFFAGMPSEISEYIQASSRVGRSHVGFSLLVPIPQRYRDRFILEVHDIFHRFLERMILPAAVDRWAEKALVRVMPSFFQEFVCGVNAVKTLCAADDDKKSGCQPFDYAADVRDFLAKPAALHETEQFMANALGLNISPAPEGAAYYRALLKRELGYYQQDLAMPRYVNGTRLSKFFEARNSSLRPMTSLRDVDQPGVIYESAFDAAYRRSPPEATARVMQFIRRGSGADVDDASVTSEE
ncbi:MAG: helicase-related protein [Sterolibacterium sp.]|nr:helicase-related protein [Sterolibacterium sp.]